jgi:AraC-like DNA-binding protein
VPTQRESQIVQRFVAAAQVAAGRAALLESGDPADLFRALNAQIPDRLTSSAQRVVRDVMAQLACRLQTIAPSDEAARQLPILMLAMLRAETAAELRAAFSDYLRARNTSTARMTIVPRSADARVRHALEYIELHSRSTALTLGDVAAAVGLSKWHVDRLLRRHTGRCFKAHVREARLNAAGGLLMTTVMSVKEIATSVGYSHATDFNRQFKRVFASTPTEWRRVRVAGEAGSRLAQNAR